MCGFPNDGVVPYCFSQHTRRRWVITEASHHYHLVAHAVWREPSGGGLVDPTPMLDYQERSFVVSEVGVRVEAAFDFVRNREVRVWKR